MEATIKSHNGISRPRSDAAVSHIVHGEIDTDTEFGRKAVQAELMHLRDLQQRDELQRGRCET